MLPGVERAIMKLADTTPDLVKALNKLAKAIHTYTQSNQPIDNVNSSTPISPGDSQEESMNVGKSYFEDVLFWHKAAGHPVRRYIEVEIGEAEQKSRELGKTLVVEEFNELMEAIKNNDYHGIADGGADLIWVICGLLGRYGINLDAMWEEIRYANWAKLGGPVREDGKLLKKPGWVPPDPAKACTGIPMGDP